MWNLFESMCVMQIYAFFLYFGKATGKKKSSENGSIKSDILCLHELKYFRHMILKIKEIEVCLCNENEN